MITVKYFASLKNFSNTDEDQFEASGISTLLDLSHAISKNHPQLGEMIRGKKIMVSVNLDVANLESEIHDGDEVALLPPFSGGTHS
ncbi:MAG: MoaD/ThiS family protein [Candidatus Nitrohelix vancouverensis]|uniref:Molybdopterin synthase sulfur carrier subunit n=1 Tax=Candidatus Nitrohelix vancouverensis TaxID=2705534 RepID=A0A7T0G3U3_9BACT|nr:MAG: MoaD/ThiS family protein [Candidatus Nitrohelix vancouverensis]